VEGLLATVLRYGSWLASAAISLGFALALIDSHFGTRNLAILPNLRIAAMGIVLFILLPTLRVLLMFLVFTREGDFRLAVTAALVLAIILLASFLGFEQRQTWRISVAIAAPAAISVAYEPQAYKVQR
jgi:hypothetical protein